MNHRRNFSFSSQARRRPNIVVDPVPYPDILVYKLIMGYQFTKIDLSDAYSEIKLAPKA